LYRHYRYVAVGWTVNTANVLWVVQSAQQLCSGLGSQYSNCDLGWQRLRRLCCGFDCQYSEWVVCWTVSTPTVMCPVHSIQWMCFGLAVNTANVMWAGQSLQWHYCGLDNHHRNVAVGWTVQQLFCGLDGQYNDCVVGWTVIITMLVWAGQSVQ